MASLLRRVAAGDMASMQDCIDEYGGLVWSLARRFCPTAADAEDAVQEVFIALWENAGRFDESKGSEVTFVATIARRRLIDSGRKRERMEAAIERAGRLQPSEPETIEETASLADEAARARAAIGQLSDDQRRVLDLAIHQGLTHREIAESTGMPLGTVKTHARRGLMRVRELLDQPQPEQPSGSKS